MMTTSPCFQCKDKEPPDCHSYCEKYIEFCEIHEQERETIRKNKEKQSTRRGYVSKSQFESAIKGNLKNRVFKQTKK